MFPGLPTEAILTYNGFSFENAYDVDVSGTPEYDPGRITILYWVYTITVHGIVAKDNGQKVDSDYENMRRRLSEPGKELAFVDHGFGPIKTVGVNRDIAFGPFPTVHRWDSAGHNKAIEYTWSVEVRVPVCESLGAQRTQGVIGVNYDISFDTDDDGDTTRTVNLTLTVANRRIGNRIADSPGNYLSYGNIPPIPGYRRKHRHSVGVDRKKLTLTITDTPIKSENPFPPSCTNITMDQNVGYRFSTGGVKYDSGISGSITLARGVHPSFAWRIFTSIALPRIQAAQNQRNLLITEIDLNESIFSRTHRFSVSWSYMSSIKDFLGDCGMFQPVGTSWNQWTASLAQSMFDRRGSLHQTHNQSMDVIIDACSGAQDITIPAPSLAGTPNQRYIKGLYNKQPDEDKSYLHYEMHLSPGRLRPLSQQTVLQDEDNVNDSSTSTSSQATNLDFGPKVGIDDTLQVGGRSRYNVVLHGHSIRAGYESSIPKIVEGVNSGATIKERRSVYDIAPIANALGVPIYLAYWYREYAIDNSPGAVRAENHVRDRIQRGRADRPTNTVS